MISVPNLSSNNNNDDREYNKLELVLGKWFAIDPIREMRDACFVREGVLIGAVSPPTIDASISCIHLNYKCFERARPETSFVAYWKAH